MMWDNSDIGDTSPIIDGLLNNSDIVDSTTTTTAEMPTAIIESDQNEKLVGDFNPVQHEINTSPMQADSNTTDSNTTLNEIPSGAVSTPTTKSTDFLGKLGKIESNNNYHVTNSLGYSGKYQFGKTTARPYLKKLGVSWEMYKKSPDIQEKMVRMFVADNKRGLTRSGFKPTELNMWMAHNMGLGGARQILRGKVSKTVLRNLRNQKGMNKNSTPADYIAYYSKIFSPTKLV